MRDRIVVDEQTPQHEPDERYTPEEVKHVRPTTGQVVDDKTAQEVGKNVADLYACAHEHGSLGNYNNSDYYIKSINRRTVRKYKYV